MPDDDFLTPGDTAELLRVVPGTLRMWRHRKVGPPFVRMTPHAHRYPRAELLDWIAARTVKP